MKRISTFKLLTMLVVLCLFLQVPTSLAASMSELQRQQDSVESKKNKLSGQINNKESEISTIENRQDKIMEQIEVLAAKIEETNNDIAKVNSDIKEAKQEIEELQQEIEYLQQKIDERTALLEERARAIQLSGTVSYIDVLLGANSFVDFIDRMSTVTTLLEADRKIMREQKEDQQKLEDQKQLLEQEKKKLEDNKAKLDSLKASLDSQSKEKNKLIDELEAEQSKLSKEKRLLEKEYSEAIQVEKSLEQQILAEQRKAAAAAAAASKNNGGSQGNNSNSSGNLPVVSAGTWTKPANGRFTSKFGWRDIGYGQEFHYGIDIANSTGTPVVAAASGVVTYAGWMNGYGNVVMITHSINGQTFATVYAHLSGFWTSKGAVVSKGQKIAPMGNTGRSFGSHLHFELHVGEWNGKRSNAVNPLRYISL